MKNFTKRDRYSVVTLRCAQGLSRWAERCFPFAEFTLERSEGLRASAHSLSMTGPVVVGTFHRRGPTLRSLRKRGFANSSMPKLMNAKPAPSRATQAPRGQEPPPRSQQERLIVLCPIEHGSPADDGDVA